MLRARKELDHFDEHFSNESYQNSTEKLKINFDYPNYVEKNDKEMEQRNGLDRNIGTEKERKKTIQEKKNEIKKKELNSWRMKKTNTQTKKQTKR